MSGHSDPAFPCQPCGQDGLPETSMMPGITILDYFAAAALPAILAHRGASMSLDYRREDAEMAYSYARAMVEQRSKIKRAESRA